MSRHLTASFSYFENLRVVQFNAYSLVKHLKSAVKHFHSTNSKKTTSLVMQSGTNDEILEISQGLIKGLKCTSLYDQIYYSFEGIPYAQPPVGSLRFKSPVPAGGWLNVRNCTEFKVKPVQKNNLGIIEGSEDCLYLNVYSKDIKSLQKLPVMVWIYGGGFSTGSCVKDKFGPDYLMHEDVVVVTFNYRVSILGFLSLSDPALKVPGNAGLKDQVLALEWVKQNIVHFGGDPNNITLFGESAGAASIHYLLSAERTRHMFHKAICMSGCMLNNWAFSYDAPVLSCLVACSKGYKGPKDNERLVLEFLQHLPANELIDVDAINDEVRARGYLYAFMPSLEPYESGDSIITQPLWASMKTAWGNEIPVVIGGTSFEGLLMYPRLKKRPEIMTRLAQQPEKLLPPDISLMSQRKLVRGLSETLRETHFGDKELNEENILLFLDYFSYRLFWHPFHRVIAARLKYASASTYQYCFDFDSPTFNHHRNMFCGKDITEGVAHADDLSYLFYSYYSRPLNNDSREYLTIQRLIKMWTTFAKNSNPNCVYVNDWEEVTTASIYKWLNIGSDLIFGDMPTGVKNKFQVWNNLYGENLIE
uniref:Carboxylic ester hydrolase n=1 Tax=Glossina austeni TaxID=7395 RepID=A0A1A9V9U0_GLOAU